MHIHDHVFQLGHCVPYYRITCDRLCIVVMQLYHCLPDSTSDSSFGKKNDLEFDENMNKRSSGK